MTPWELLTSFWRKLDLTVEITTRKPTALYTAQDEHYARMQKVQDVMQELEQLLESLPLS